MPFLETYIYGVMVVWLYDYTILDLEWIYCEGFLVLMELYCCSPLGPLVEYASVSRF